MLDGIGGVMASRAVDVADRIDLVGVCGSEMPRPEFTIY